MELDEIMKYITGLREDEEAFKNQSNAFFGSPVLKNSKKGPLIRRIKLIFFILISTTEFIELVLRFRFDRKFVENKKIVYTARNFCNEVDGHLVDRIVKPLFTENIIFINQSKEIYISKINDSRVYNIGGVVKCISLFYRRKSPLMRLFLAYQRVNNLLLRELVNKEIYMLWFYDLNSLSLVFSKYRSQFTLIEVQHGSIINYPPYVQPSPIKIADIFYVKNQQTIEYLKSHLCKGFPSNYRLIPYPVVKKRRIPGIHILYASTIDFNGFHPVMKKFLSENTRKDIDLAIRLHPRERHNKSIFINQLQDFSVSFRFDDSENWLEGNPIENLIVISPWSSTIEDAFDNGITTIIIDPVGQQRFKNLINDRTCIYSADIAKTIEQISR